MINKVLFMKRKLVLLPIILMSTFLGACQKEREHINVEEYLNVKPSDGYAYFSVGEDNKIDYEGKVQNIFKKYLNDLTAEPRYYFPQEECDYVGLSIYGEYKGFSSFTINVYGVGQINTYCSGEYKPQETTYLIDESVAKALIKEVTDRRDEIDSIIKQSEETAIEEHNVDKFFEILESVSNKSFKYQDITYTPQDQMAGVTTYTVNDTDGSLTEELKNIGYHYMPNNHSKRRDFSIEYKVNDNWYLRIFSSYYYIATVTYKYSNPFYETEVQMDYNINDNAERTRTNAFIEKIRELVIR